MNSKNIGCVVICLFTISILIQSGFARTLGGVEILTDEWRGEPIEYLDKEILVGLQVDKTQQDLEAELSPLAVEIVRSADRFGFLKLQAKNGDALFTLIEAVENLPSVRYAEPNMVDHQFVIPNDPMFNQQWHYHNTGQTPPGGTVDADIDAPEGWDISTGSSTIMVGVLDSGIPMQGGVLSHPDLDDPTRYFLGYDYANGDTEPADDNGHGTHVSGTIAAETDNSTGVAGVCWNAKIMAIKVFDRYGSGSHENFRDGCIYVADHGCKVINYSGGGSAGSTKEHGVAYADTHGVIVCAAAGNSWQGSVSWPGAYSTSYTNVICVSSSDHNDQSSPFSSIGPEVTICAPGGYGSPFDEDDIISTFPNYEVQLNIDYGLPQDYSPLAGTSMATPHVTGFAALILSLNPSLMPDSVRYLMMNTADDLGPAGFDNQFGWGRINVYNALSQIGALVISHTPLEDTKETVEDYEVLCTIFSDNALVADSLLLRYEISSAWYLDTLEATGGENEYHAFIPAQIPGTEINYYLYAQNIVGDVDSTETYSFRVIDYALTLLPPYQNMTSAAEDTAWYPLWLKNDGVYSDSYNLSISGNDWVTTIFDSAGTTPISVTPIINLDDSIMLMVRVEIPVSMYGDADSALVTATSIGDPSVFESAIVYTMSTGYPLTLPFSDDFPSTTIDVGKWVKNLNCYVNDIGIAEPSSPYSLNLNGNPAGGDTLASQVIDLSGLSNAILKYYYQRTGGGDSPEAGDDLKVDYFTVGGSWVNLMTHSGDDPDMNEFELVELILPIGAFHAGFRLQFVSEGTDGPYDDWFVDDVFVGYPSDYDFAVIPLYQEHFGPADDTATAQIIIYNNGLYADDYLLSDTGSTWNVSFWDVAGTTQITSTGTISPVDSAIVLVKTEIPVGALLNEADSAWVIVTSNGDPLISKSVIVVTISAGQAAAFPWYEPFPDPTIDMSRWMINIGVTVAEDTLLPPSPPYAANLDGGKDTLVSQLIDLSGQSGALLMYHYQRTGPGESPDDGDDLFLDYMNSSGIWVTISQQLGSGDDMTVFEGISIPLLPDAMHNSFQLRIRSLGSGETYDDWYVDDIRVDYAPAIRVTPDFLSYNLELGDSTQGEIVISNVGLGTLNYTVQVLPAFAPSSVFGGLLAVGAINPARYDYAEDFFDLEPIKGADDPRCGVDIVYNAGGPDAYGYIWIDSDETGGPDFNWLDIQGTGVEITGFDDDNYVGPYPIGFDFSYYGVNYTEFYVASNGFIGFGPTDDYNLRFNVVLPLSDSPNNILAWCWDDLNILDADNPGGKVFYQLDASQLIIQFVDYPEFDADPGDVINAEVIIKSDGTITYQYLSIAPGFDILGGTVGIENINGTDGLTVVFNASYLHDSLVVEFMAPAQWLTVEPLAGGIAPGFTDTLLARVVTEDLDSGYYQANIIIHSNDPDTAVNPTIIPVDLLVYQSPDYICGDADGNEIVEVADAVYLVAYIFQSGPAPDPVQAGEVDCNDIVEVTDAVYLINYIFNEGPEPCADCPQ